MIGPWKCCLAVVLALARKSFNGLLWVLSTFRRSIVAASRSGFPMRSSTSLPGRMPCMNRVSSEPTLRTTRSGHCWRSGSHAAAASAR